MSSEIKNDLIGAAGETSNEEYVTAIINGQLFGIPVLSIQDVLGPRRLANVPPVPPEVAGALNLRGRIVTAIELRTRLGLSKADREKSMSVVVDHYGELYSLPIDEIGEVLSVPTARYERNPPTLDANWREISAGIYRLDGNLLVVLEVEKLLDFDKSLAA